jgi:hypothetical protein
MNFLNKIILAITFIFFITVGVAFADGVNWSDASQVFDDTINGGVTQYISWYGSPTLSYVSPNILNINSSIGYASLSNLTTPIDFVWVTRFKYYTTNNYGYFYWNLNSSGTTYDGFGCNNTGICSAISSGTTLATASTAIPSTCFSNSSLPSTWCWAKVIRSGTGSTGTLYVAPDVNGSPGTFVQYVTSSGFDIGTTGRIAPGVGGTMQIGGNYPCINHISTNTSYNCFAYADQKMQFNDNFWNSASYTLSGNASVSSNTLNIGANADSQNDGAYFQPFGNITQGKNFVWEYRVNSNNGNNNLLTHIFANSPTAGICPQAALALSQQTTANYNLIYTGNACASTTTITSGLANPNPPYYVKLVYNAPSLTAYYATVTSGNTYSSLTWNILIPSTNLSSYLGNSSTFLSNNLGSYFGFTAINTIASIGGGSQYSCQNYVSANIGWDCFNQATYLHNFKSTSYVGSSNIIYDTFQNSTDSNLNTTSGASIGSGQLSWVANGSTTYAVYYTGTAGWNNSSIFTRVTTNTVDGIRIVLHSNGVINGSGCYADLSPGQLFSFNYNGGSVINSTTFTSPLIKANTSYYIYFYYYNGNYYTNVYSELSPGVVGSQIINGSIACTQSAGYIQLGNSASSVNGNAIGGTGTSAYPLILRNYGTFAPPPAPLLGYLNSFVKNFSDAGILNLSQYTIFMNTPTITSNGYADPSNSGSRYGLTPAGFTGQNKAAVMRFNPNGCALSTCTGSLYLAYTNDSNILNIAMNGGNLLLQNNGNTVASTSDPSTSTGAYDIFASNNGTNFYGQVCGESSVGVPNFNSCTSVISASSSGVTIAGTPTDYVLNANSSPGSTTYMGGAYPYLQVRDYGDNNNVPTTLSQFLRGY